MKNECSVLPPCLWAGVRWSCTSLVTASVPVHRALCPVLERRRGRCNDSWLWQTCVLCGRGRACPRRCPQECAVSARSTVHPSLENQRREAGLAAGPEGMDEASFSLQESLPFVRSSDFDPTRQMTQSLTQVINSWVFPHESISSKKENVIFS